MSPSDELNVALALTARVIEDIDAAVVRLGQSGAAPPEMVARIWRLIDSDPAGIDPLLILGSLVVLRQILADLEAAGGES